MKITLQYGKVNASGVLSICYVQRGDKDEFIAEGKFGIRQEDIGALVNLLMPEFVTGASTLRLPANQRLEKPVEKLVAITDSQ